MRHSDCCPGDNGCICGGRPDPISPTAWEITLEDVLHKILEFGADPNSSEMDSLIDCVELAEETLKASPFRKEDGR